MGTLERRPRARRAGWITAAAAVCLAGCAVDRYHRFDVPEPASAAPPSALPVRPASAATSSNANSATENTATTPTATHPGEVTRVAGSTQAPTVEDPPKGKKPPGALQVPVPLTPTPQPSEAPPGTRLTVDQVINAVLVSDPRLRAGFEAVNQANADALTASLRPNPTLFTDAQLLPLTRPFTATAQGGPPQQDVQVTYPIDWFVFGKRAANMAAAALGVRVSEAEFADRVRLRVTEAALGYYDVLEARALLDLAHENVTSLEQVEAALAKGVEAGGRPRVELDRLRLDLLRSRQSLRDAETALVTTKARLRAMIGRTDADPAFDVEGSLEAPLTATPPPSEEGFAVAVRDRPDIQALRLRGAQARASVEAERRQAFPQVAPMFGYTRQYQTKAIGFPDANSWVAALTMSLPISDRNQGNRAKAASAVAQVGFEYQAALADLRAEIETAARDYLAARANAEAVSGAQLRLAREVLGSVQKSYAAGGLPLLDLLDARRNFRETYRAYITIRAAYWRAVYRYGATIGQQIPK